MDDRIPGEGTVNDYLATVPYRKNATCWSFILGTVRTGRRAFSKVMAKTGDRYDGKGDRKYALEYYRSLGMAHAGKGRGTLFHDNTDAVM
mgnify:CR=1 FL=1